MDFLIRCGRFKINKKRNRYIFIVINYGEYYERNECGPGMDDNDGGVQDTLLREN